MAYSIDRIPLVERRPSRTTSETSAKLPAVAYVRMSTEHQQYSTQNQLARIYDYAAGRQIAILRVYQDEGKSGLKLEGREALQELLRTAESGQAEFRAILVYDISRWGRFQDADESGYYEYLCRRAGIALHYCAEQFENDGSPSSNIIKSVKRSMAGEYSRELSAKVFQGACRLIRLGYKQGGTAGFGLRRMVVDPAGNPRGKLETGQQKFLATDRVVLVPGPAHEVEIVRNMFEAYVNERLSPDKIAERLNVSGVRNEQGRPWRGQGVHNLLSNEKYIGNLVYYRHTSRLRTPMRSTPADQWIRVEGVFPAIVDVEMFRRAAEIRRQRHSTYTDDELLTALKNLWNIKGRLSSPLINAEPGMPSSSTYSYRWGSLVKAYQLIGYRAQRDGMFHRVNRQLVHKRNEILNTLAAELHRRGLAATARIEDGTIRTSEVLVAVGCIRCQRTKNNTLQWSARTEPNVDLTLLARMDEDHRTVYDYFLFPSLDRQKSVVLRRRNHVLLEAYRCPSLERLLGLLARETVEA